MILVGSKALKHWIPLSREGFDYDVSGTKDEFDAWVRDNRSNIMHIHNSHKGQKYNILMEDRTPIEFEISNPKSSCELLEKINTGPIINFYGTDIKIGDVNVLFVCKKSHITKPIHWWKHIRDYHVLKPLTNLTEKHLLALKRRIKETDARHPKSPKPNLNMSNDDFFNKSEKYVGRQYRHDFLHESTCFYDRPLFERLKFDKSKAKLEKSLFMKLNHEDKIKLVQEECFAIALERQIIPNRTTDQRLAFNHALERICTTLTSGWFREFAIDHVPAILDFKVKYADKFMEKINEDCLGR